MSYEHTWAKTFYNNKATPPPSYAFEPVVCGPTFLPPDRCPQHEGCFRCRDNVLTAQEQCGTWKMRLPMDMLSEMPGVNQKLTLIGAKAMFDGKKGWGGWLTAHMRLIGDGAEIYRTPKLEIPRLRWEEDANTFNINLDIGGYAELEIRLHQHAVCRPPESYVAIHVAKMILSGLYYTDVPPERGDVTINVTNCETGAFISNALVTLKSGAVVVARKYTNGGSVTFSNIDVGSYTIKVVKGEYEPLTDSIEVIVPAVEYDVCLMPIPVAPLPWWAIPAVAGTVVIGGVATISGMRKARPPVYVVK